MDSKDADSLDAAFSRRSESDAIGFFVGFMSAARLCLWARVGILRFCNPNDQHDLVVRPHDVAIQASCLGVNGASAIVVLLLWPS